MGSISGTGLDGIYHCLKCVSDNTFYDFENKYENLIVICFDCGYYYEEKGSKVIREDFGPIFLCECGRGLHTWNSLGEENPTGFCIFCGAKDVPIIDNDAVWVHGEPDT